MKLSKFILIFSLLAAAYGPAMARESFQDTSGRVSGIPAVPTAGTTVPVIYDPTGGPLEGRSELTGIAYLFNFYRWVPVDIELTLEQGCWSGTLDIPDSCALVALAFQSTYTVYPDAVDNNDDQGFIYIVNHADGHPMPGSALAWAILRKSSLGCGVINYFSPGYEEISSEAAHMWLNKEFERYQQYGLQFLRPMMDIVRSNT
ncbi:MAG: hypothetical protein LUD68_10060, partial [Rikenellaceae bacterium]|nr:hypothetical protein [Rikenellaceae bacterium]